MSNVDKAWLKITLLKDKIREMSDRAFVSDQTRCIYMNGLFCDLLAELRGMNVDIVNEGNPIISISFEIKGKRPGLTFETDFVRPKGETIEYSKFLKLLSGE
jgi:hypothetical protein